MSIFRGSAPFPPTKTPARAAHGPTKAEQAVWSDPEHLARVEAVLDDPGLAVPLEELDCALASPPVHGPAQPGSGLTGSSALSCR